MKIITYNSKKNLYRLVAVSDRVARESKTPLLNGDCFFSKSKIDMSGRKATLPDLKFAVN